LSTTGLILVALGVVLGLLGPVVASDDVVILNMWRQLLGHPPAGERAIQGFKWLRVTVAGILVVGGVVFLLLD
jgi:hypothetical protein